MSRKYGDEEDPSLAQEIEETEQSLTNTGSRRNDLAPISRLPVVLFASIASYTKWFPDMTYRYIKRMPQIWMCAIVSRRWYQIIMSSPYMWDVVNANWTVRRIRAWFARSKTAKLRVWMDGVLEDRGLAVVPRLISTELSRIRSLHIITSAALMDYWRHALDHDAPVLEAFSLFVTYPRRRDYDCRLNLVFPASYFHGRPPPLLREFEFGGPHIIWTSPHLQNLTCLQVHGHDRSNRPTVPLAQVLRALRRLPLLQYLDAAYEAFPDNDENPQNLTVIMPQLKSLRFWGGFERWCPLFIRLVLPFATEIDLNSTSRGPSDAVVLFDYLAVHFRDESGSGGRRNAFDAVAMYQDKNGLRLRAECIRPTGRSPLHVDIKSTDQHEEVYRKFTAIVPVSRATNLYLTGLAPCLSQWKGIGRAMRSLTVLRLVGETCKTFPRVVLEVDYSTRPFMRLLRIEVEKASFRVLTTTSDENFWEKMGRSIVDIWEKQIIERPWQEHLKVVRFLACDGDVDPGFVRLLDSRGIEVQSADPMT